MLLKTFKIFDFKWLISLPEYGGTTIMIFTSNVWLSSFSILCFHIPSEFSWILSTRFSLLVHIFHDFSTAINTRSLLLISTSILNYLWKSWFALLNSMILIIRIKSVSVTTGDIAATTTRVSFCSQSNSLKNTTTSHYNFLMNISA